MLILSSLPCLPRFKHLCLSIAESWRRKRPRWTVTTVLSPSSTAKFLKNVVRTFRKIVLTPRSHPPPSMKSSPVPRRNPKLQNKTTNKPSPLQNILDRHLNSISPISCFGLKKTEYYRLKVAREAFLALESAQLFTVEAHTRLWTVDVDPEHAHASGGGSSYTASSTTSSDENAVPALRLITPSPSHGIENIAMRLRTGSRHSPPFVFDPYVPPSTDSPTSASIPSPRQAFGIPLDDLAKATGDPIPAVVRKCVASFD
ncbi:hypothetical protein BC829DRAFT_119330 [Chytridium lagenaria]|nr:hypothetical protein BC829DRAFT_119330 [Chytridium lagenaria]